MRSRAARRRRAGCAASAAAGVDRRAGAALRLLPERDDDPGRRPAGDDEAPDRGADPHGDERPSLPLRHLSADPDRDPEGRRRDGEGRASSDDRASCTRRSSRRKTFLKGGGALIVGFSVARRRARRQGERPADNPFASNGRRPVPDRLVDRDPRRQHGVDQDGRDQAGHGVGHRAADDRRRGAGHGHEPAQVRRSPTRRLTPNTGKHSASNTIRNAGPGVRAAAAYGEAGAARPGVDAARRAGVAASRQQGRRLRRRQVGHVRRAARRQAVQRHDAGELDMNPTAARRSRLNTGYRQGISGQAPAKPVSQYKLVGTTRRRGSTSRRSSPEARPTSTNIRVPGMLHGRVVRPRGQAVVRIGAPIVSVDESSIKHIPASRSSARATSSAWSRRRSTTRSRRPRS